MTRHKKCKVMAGRDHLATIWYLDDGRWTLEQHEVHVPIDLVPHIRLFESYVGTAPPPLVRQLVMDKGIALAAADPIGTLLMLGTAGHISFVL